MSPFNLIALGLHECDVLCRPKKPIRQICSMLANEGNLPQHELCLFIGPQMQRSSYGTCCFVHLVQSCLLLLHINAAQLQGQSSGQGTLKACGSLGPIEHYKNRSNSTPKPIMWVCQSDREISINFSWIFCLSSVNQLLSSLNTT